MSGYSRRQESTPVPGDCVVERDRFELEISLAVLPGTQSQTPIPVPAVNAAKLPMVLREVKAISLSQWNNGYGADCGRSRGGPRRVLSAHLNGLGNGERQRVRFRGSADRGSERRRRRRIGRQGRQLRLLLRLLRRILCAAEDSPPDRQPRRRCLAQLGIPEADPANAAG
jgi:hypothetical protein